MGLGLALNSSALWVLLRDAMIARMSRTKTRDYGGHDPACVRLFLPAGCLSEEELAAAFEILAGCL